jgi:hypothetical protein
VGRMQSNYYALYHCVCVCVCVCIRQRHHSYVHERETHTVTDSDREGDTFTHIHTFFHSLSLSLSLSIYLSLSLVSILLDLSRSLLGDRKVERTMSHARSLRRDHAPNRHFARERDSQNFSKETHTPFLICNLKMQKNVRITSPKSCPDLGTSMLRRKQNLTFKKRNQNQNQKMLDTNFNNYISYDLNYKVDEAKSKI